MVAPSSRPAKATKPRRRSARFSGFDYTSAGSYFVTICTSGRACTLGQIVRGVLRPTELGVLAQRCWDAIPDHFPHVDLDAFVVMPNHVHGILHLRGGASQGDAPTALPGTAIGDGVEAMATGPRGPAPGSVGAIVGSYKSAVSRLAAVGRRSASGRGAPIWLRNYHESIIPDPIALLTIRAYIRANPTRWTADRSGDGRGLSSR